jgi:short-subunit dehydrogenase
MNKKIPTWLITGASRGLGKHLTRVFAAHGYRVLACARDTSRLNALASEFKSGCVLPVPLDLADAASIRPRVLAAVQSAGALDGIINNAGIGEYKPFLDHSEAELCTLIQVNLTACIQICHALLPMLRAQGHGHIVNIGSDLGRRPLANMAAYVASKHGLTGFSHSLLREVKGDGIKVSLVNPGIIDTDFGGGREGDKPAHASLAPADLARLILAVIEQPASIVVDELTVHPLRQTDF